MKYYVSLIFKEFVSMGEYAFKTYDEAVFFAKLALEGYCASDDGSLSVKLELRSDDE